MEITLTLDQMKRISYNNNGLQNGNKVKIVANVTETLTGQLFTELFCDCDGNLEPHPAG